MTLVGLALVAALAGCGSSDGDSGASTSAGGSTGGSDNAAQTAARAEVARFTATQPAIRLPRLTRPAPRDIEVALISCPVTVCVTSIRGAEAAARAIGWRPTVHQAPLTPEGYGATWTTALRSNPDAIAYIGGNFPNRTVSAQLEEAKRRGIAVVGLANAEPPDELVPAVYNGSPQFAESGRLEGNLVAAEAGADADVVYVDPQLPVFADMRAAIARPIEEAGGRITDLRVNLAGIGRTIPSQLVSYLQSNPSTNYIVLALNDLGIGVPQALQAAGLADRVKIVSRAPSTAALADVASGAQYAAIAEETTTAGWRAIDGLARLLNEEELGDCCTYPAGWHQILTERNVTDIETTPQAPGTPESFLAAWGVAR